MNHELTIEPRNLFLVSHLSSYFGLGLVPSVSYLLH